MTEIEELIEQAKMVKAKLKMPKANPEFTDRTWQEILDGADYPKLRHGKL